MPLLSVQLVQLSALDDIRSDTVADAVTAAQLAGTAAGTTAGTAAGTTAGTAAGTTAGTTAALSTLQGLDVITPTLAGYNQTQRQLTIVAGNVTVPLDGIPSYINADANITGWTITAPPTGKISDTEIAVWYSVQSRSVAMPSTYSAFGVGALPFSTVENWVYLLFLRRIPGSTFSYRADVVPYRV
jgi:hypothetical protein